MSRRSKGPRLWLRNAQYGRDGKLTHVAVWIIKDGKHRESTGCGANDRRRAEAALANYIGRKHLADAEAGVRPLAQIPVADVIALYGRDIAPKHSRPRETAQRIAALLGFFGDKVLSDVNGALCRAYVGHRGSIAAARRELEELRAAINHHRKEGLCSAIVEVVLPAAAPARERWPTRAEAAALLWAAWRYREVQKGKPTGRRSRQHIAKFILLALYTGTRAGAVCGAALSSPRCLMSMRSSCQLCALSRTPVWTSVIIRLPLRPA
jgi:integrase